MTDAHEVELDELLDLGSADDVDEAPEGHDVDPIGAKPRRRRLPRSTLPRPGRIRSGWFLLAPAVLVVLALTLWPIGLTVWNALHRRMLTTPADDSFVGADNLVDVVTSRQWWLAVCVSLLFVAVVVVVQLVAAGVLAAALRRVAVPRPVTTVLLLTPFALFAVVSAATWRDALTTGIGPAWFGYDGDHVGFSLAATVAAEVWRGTGITTLILMVGLHRVNRRLLESAIADGATRWQRLRRVAWPAVAPAVAVAVVFRSFEAFRALEGSVLASSSTTLRTAPLLVWDTTFSSFEIGLGAATSLVMLAVALVLGLVLVLALRPGRQ